MKLGAANAPPAISTCPMHEKCENELVPELRDLAKSGSPLRNWLRV